VISWLINVDFIQAFVSVLLSGCFGRFRGQLGARRLGSGRSGNRR